MDTLEDLKKHCYDALLRDNVQDLYKYLPKLQRATPQKEFYLQFMPDLMKKSALAGAENSFRYILEFNTNFQHIDARETYETLFKKRKYSMIALYWKKAEKHLPVDEFKRLKTETSLQHAYNIGDVELARFAILHGGNIRRKNYDQTSHFLYKAMERNNLELMRLALDHGANYRANYVEIIELMQRNNNENIVPFIELMLEYGHLSPDPRDRTALTDASRSPRYNSYYRGYHSPPFDKAEEFTDKVFKKWIERGEFKRFPARFKPAMKTENLSSVYNAAAGYRTTALHGLAMGDRFQDAVNIAIRDQKPLRLDDLMAKDGRGYTVIDILGARKTLHILNNPTLWQNNSEDYFKLVRMTTPVYRIQYDVERMENAFKFSRYHKKLVGKDTALKRRGPK